VRFGGRVLLALAALGAVSAVLGGVGSWLGFLPSTWLGLVDAALLAVFGFGAERGSRSALFAGLGLHVASTIGALALLLPEAGPSLSGAITLRVLIAALLVRAWLPGSAPSGRPRIPPQATAPEPANPAALAPSAQPADIRRRQTAVQVQGDRMTGASGIDRARRSLEHVALRCVAGDAGLEVTGSSGPARSIAWSAVRRVVVRMLPPDPPYGGLVLLDVWPDKGAPVRLMPTTVVQGFAPCGATARLERVRAQAAEILARAGEATADPATRAFVEGTAKIARFAAPSALHEYELGGPDVLGG
jgi:hypothetical protein